MGVSANGTFLLSAARAVRGAAHRVTGSTDEPSASFELVDLHLATIPVF